MQRQPRVLFTRGSQKNDQSSPYTALGKMPLVALTTLILAAGQRRSAQRELAEAWAAAQSGTTPKCACKDESVSYTHLRAHET